MDIEVGEYYRCEGEVGKVELDYGNRFADRWGNMVYKCDVEKHSKIVSEVVEVGDLVNGKLIYKIDKGTNYCYLYYDNEKTFASHQIKTILTHEMYESNCYRLED